MAVLTLEPCPEPKGTTILRQGWMDPLFFARRGVLQPTREPQTKGNHEETRPTESPMTPAPNEPEVVTLAKMNDHLNGRLTDTRAALAEAEAAVARLALEAERTGGDALRKLAVEEKRRDTLKAEAERLQQATEELHRELQRERDAAEAAVKRDMVNLYIARREFLQESNLAMLKTIEGLRPAIQEALKKGREAAQIALRLGFGDERSDAALGPKLGFLKGAFLAVTGGGAHLASEARYGVLRDWRDSPNGRRALALQAALDSCPTGETTTDEVQP
jgi:hypothetical protein